MSLEREQDANRPKLLVVEDDRSILPLIKMLLDTEYDVFTAEGGQKAMEILEKHGGMPVVSDHKYPDGGLEKLHEWMANHKNTGIRKSAVLAMSGNTYAQMREFAEPRGIPFIKKPFEVPIFLDAVKELVRRHRRQQSQQ